MRINVTRSDVPDFDEFCEAIRPLWESRWLTNNGENVLKLATQLEEQLQVKHACLFCNGHLGLEALMSRFRDGEVITTPFSFASTTHAIVRKGLVPVFADIREEDYTLDPEKAEKRITNKTRAILPVHVYGHFCDTEAFDRISQKYGIPVIYDAAHTFGETKNGLSPAHFGLASLFSFHATKVYHTIEGGCVATNDDALAAHMELERNYGITSAVDVVSVGGNAKMNEFEAVMGLLELKRLRECISKRKAVHERYVQNLKGTKALRLPPMQEKVQRNYAYFPVYFEGGAEVRNAVCNRLAEDGIFARKYFYPLISDFECYRGLYDSTETPIAKRISEGIVTLPLYPDLPLSEVDRICELTLEAMRHE